MFSRTSYSSQLCGSSSGPLDRCAVQRMLQVMQQQVALLDLAFERTHSQCKPKVKKSADPGLSSVLSQLLDRLSFPQTLGYVSHIIRAHCLQLCCPGPFTKPARRRIAACESVKQHRRSLQAWLAAFGHRARTQPCLDATWAARHLSPGPACLVQQVCQVRAPEHRMVTLNGTLLDENLTWG